MEESSIPFSSKLNKEQIASYYERSETETEKGDTSDSVNSVRCNHCNSVAEETFNESPGVNKGKYVHLCPNRNKEKCEILCKKFYKWSERKRVPSCKCGVFAVRRISKKPGSEGAAFYSCCNWPFDGNCRFFVWEEECPGSNVFVGNASSKRKRSEKDDEESVSKKSKLDASTQKNLCEALSLEIKTIVLRDVVKLLKGSKKNKSSKKDEEESSSTEEVEETPPTTPTAYQNVVSTPPPPPVAESCTVPPVKFSITKAR